MEKLSAARKTRLLEKLAHALKVKLAGTGRQLASKPKSGYWDNFLKRLDPSPPKALPDSFLRKMDPPSPTPSQFTRPIDHMSGKEQRLRQSLPREQRYDAAAPAPPAPPAPRRIRLPGGGIRAGMLT